MEPRQNIYIIKGEKDMADQLKRRIEVNLMRTVNIGNYESVKGGVSLSQNIEDSADEDVVYEALWETVEKQLDDYLSQYEQDEAKNESEPEQPLEEEVEPEEAPEEEAPEEEAPEEEAELDITEEEINKMTKPELVTLCKTTEGMEDIDLNLNVKPLRAVIIDLIFEDEESPEEPEEGEEGTEDGEEGEDPKLDETGGEWDQDDWQDQE